VRVRRQQKRFNWERFLEKPTLCPPNAVQAARRSKAQVVRELAKALDRRMNKRDLHDADFASLLALRIWARNLHLACVRESARRSLRWQRKKGKAEEAAARRRKERGRLDKLAAAGATARPKKPAQQVKRVLWRL
jgi:hypothetical protein